MNNQDFDRLLNTIREDEPSADAVQAAGERVHERLERQLAGRTLCEGFREEFAPYRAGTLTDAKRMLLEDHLHSCVECRREYAGATKVVPMIPKRRFVGRYAWVAAAAAVLIVASVALPKTLDRAFAPSGPRGTIASIDGSVMLVSAQGATALAIGSAIAEGEEIRTGKGSRAIVKLRDGSLVEMAERSEVTLSEVWSGKTVHLERGNVMVEAAKQRRGTLDIVTPECLVSVKGTIFAVSHGLNGSRVSVVDGEVKVAQGDNVVFLHRGNQAMTRRAIQALSVADDISWSQNAAKYLALLGDFAIIQAKVDQIPLPGLRYSSTLLDRVPTSAVVVVSIPNLTQPLMEATQIIQNRVQDSPDLAAWWQGQGGTQVQMALDRVRTASSYLGDEIVVWLQPGTPPVVLAQVKQPGLADYLAQNGYTGNIAVQDNLVAIGAATVPPPDGFNATPFGQRILQSYQQGAGILFAASLEQIVPKGVIPNNVPGTLANSPNPMTVVGLDNVQYLVAESKTYQGSPMNTASVSFAAARHGVLSWLASPGPMGSLEFISQDATFSSTFLMRDPRQMLTELIESIGPQAASTMSQIQQTAGFSPVDDVAASLGGEATFAVDGALLPTPSWKIAIEVEDPARLEWSIEQALAAASKTSLSNPPALNKQDADGRTYYTISSTMLPFEIDYTFVDGYVLIAPSRALLMSSIQNRAAGLTLPHSTDFQSQLPLDGQLNFSALVYYNLGKSIGPIADQLKATGFLNPQQQETVSTLTSNRAPSLVYIYGQPDRILVGSRTGIAGMGLNVLGGIGSLRNFTMRGLLATQ